jgi:hypothetical protein
MQPHDTQPGAGIPEQFDRISATVLGAHEAPLREAFDRELWERRGLLGRLVRRPPSRAAGGSLVAARPRHVP